MPNAQQNKTLGVRILLGVIVAILGAGMLLYLLPGQGTMGSSNTDVVAQVGDQSITAADVRQQLSRVSQNSPIPPALQPLYVQQILNQLIFQKELLLEAKQLGIQVSDQERADRIRLLIPTAFVGGSFIGNDQYAQQVQERTNLGVPEFEDLVGQSLIEEKFRGLVTDGVEVTPAQIQEEFRRRNDKVKIAYVVIKPEDLDAKIHPSDAELATFFEQRKARYQVPEKRVLQWALLDMDQLRTHVNIPDDEIRAYYNQNLNRYKMEDRAHVAHILFKTVGKTDAEVEEIRKKADDVLKKAKSGANFGELAKQYSDDTSKDKGGDLDWIVRGQTVPEFEKVAFSIPKGSVSDLVKTPYGFHIIKVIDRQEARTQSVDEVRPQIIAALQQGKAQEQADTISNHIADEIRRSGRVPLDDLAKKNNLILGETQPLEAGQPILEVGNSPELADTIARLRVGDDSAPVRTDKGYVVLSLKQINNAHPGTLGEVHDQVLADYRRDKAVGLAKTEAEELARRAKQGEDLDKSAKSLGLALKTSELVARSASIPDIGSASQIQQAFTLPDGQTAPPMALGENWLVYRILQHQKPDLSDLPKQQDDISKQLLAANRDLAFESFRNALDVRMRQERKLHIDDANLKRINTPQSSSGL